jgi:hypothetical protein
MKYKLRPIIIDAQEWDGSPQALAKIQAMVTPANSTKIQYVAKTNSLFVQSLYGTVVAQVGDFVVNGLDGDIFLVKANIFSVMAAKAE